MKVIEYLFIILGIMFAVFVLMGLRTNQGMGAVDNFCAPVHWVGNVSVSISAVVDPHTESMTRTGMNKLHYSCEYIGWRLFFQKQYIAWKKEQAARKEAGLAYGYGTRPAPRYHTQARYSGGAASINPVTGGENVINQGAPK